MSRVQRRPRPTNNAPLPAAGQHREGWVEYIPIGELRIDSGYQRDVDYAFVNEIAHDFDYTQLDLQAWSIARRMRGRVEHADYIIDGQHRWLALQQREPNDFVVACHVRISLGVEWEANEYLRINFARKQPTSQGRFKAAVVAGRKFGWDNDAAVAELLDELGIPTPTSTRHTFSRSTTLPVLFAIGKVCRLHLIHGADFTRLVLTSQRDAWGETSSKAYDGIIFDGLTDFWAAHEGECTLADAVKVLRGIRPEVLRDAGEQMRGARSYPVRVCIARTIAVMYNKGRRIEHRVSELAPINYASARQSRVNVIKQAALSPDERRARAQRGADAQTPEQHTARGRKGSAALTPAERSQRSLTAWATRRRKQQEAAS